MLPNRWEVLGQNSYNHFMPNKFRNTARCHPDDYTRRSLLAQMAARMVSTTINYQGMRNFSVSSWETWVHTSTNNKSVLLETPYVGTSSPASRKFLSRLGRRFPRAQTTLPDKRHGRVHSIDEDQCCAISCLNGCSKRSSPD